MNTPQDQVFRVEIGTPELSVYPSNKEYDASKEQQPLAPRRGRPPKVRLPEVSPEPAPAPAPEPVTEATPTDPGPKLIRVKPKNNITLYCHTQQKLIYRGFETLVVRDKWIDNQIKKGVLILV